MIPNRKSPTELLYGSPVRLLPKVSVAKSEAVPAVADFIDRESNAMARDL